MVVLWDLQVLATDLTYTELLSERCTPTCSGAATWRWPAASGTIQCDFRAGRGPDLHAAAAGACHADLLRSGGPAVACGFDGRSVRAQALVADLFYAQVPLKFARRPAQERWHGLGLRLRWLFGATPGVRRGPDLHAATAGVLHAVLLRGGARLGRGSERLVGFSDPLGLAQLEVADRRDQAASPTLRCRLTARASAWRSS